MLSAAIVPGKTELHHDILMRSSIFTEFTAADSGSRGEIQQLPGDQWVGL